MAAQVRVPVVLTSEHDELRENVRAFFSDVAPESEVRRLMATDEGFDPAVWSRLSRELGLTGLTIPEELGGSGFGFVEVGVVLEEAGRALLPAPYFSTVVLATTLLLAIPDQQAQQDYLPRLADGELRATVVEPRAGESVTATESANGWALSGEATLVVDGATAQLLLVVAQTPAGQRVFAVDGDAAGLARTTESTLDLTRKLAAVRFADVPGRPVGGPGSVADALERLHLLAAIGLATEQVGGAQRVLEMGVQHARDRYQFGRPIGSFQAIKHRLADMLVKVESARSAAYAALWSVQLGAPDLAVAAALAKAYASDAYVWCAGENIQVHGGIGFTWEHPAHLYFKRAKSSQLLFGSPSDHLERVAAHLGI